MVSDIKKVQTMINVLAEQIEIVRSAVATMKEVRTAFQLINPDVTGTPLEGQVAATNTALNALDAEASGPVWSGMIAAKVPTHRNRALD